jgi:hypothetical protein
MVLCSLQETFPALLTRINVTLEGAKLLTAQFVDEAQLLTCVMEAEKKKHIMHLGLTMGDMIQLEHHFKANITRSGGAGASPAPEGGGV